MFSRTCLHASEASFLMSSFVNFSPVQDQSMLYLKEEGFIQVTLDVSERAATAVLDYVKGEYGPQ